MAVSFTYTSGIDPGTGLGFVRIDTVTTDKATYEATLSVAPTPPELGTYYGVISSLPFQLTNTLAENDYLLQLLAYDEPGDPDLSDVAAFTITFPQPPPLPVADATPPALAAAHLPMMLVLHAEPIEEVAAALLVVVETPTGPLGAWKEVGRLREVCDPVNGTARFNLSEYVKTQFTPTPPAEEGMLDTALGIRYRVRYGRLPDFTGVAATEAGTFTGLALNAAEVINPEAAALPYALGPAAPYVSVLTGYARYRSTINAGATGVTNVDTVPEVASDCAVRQFVWLHPSGAWVWGFFTGKHEHGTDVGDGQAVRYAGGVERYTRRGDVRRTLRVYSDRIDRATFDVLVSVRDSVQVYERLASGLYVPVLVDASSFRDYQETDKLYTVDFTVRYPVLARQTQ